MTRLKLIHAHRAGCSAVEHTRLGFWTSPWWFPGITSHRDRAGRLRSNGGRWIHLQCNATDCQGEIAISEHELCELIHRIEGGAK